MKLFINNDVLLNTKLSDEAIAVFVALKAIYRSDCDKYYVAVNHVVSVLTGHLSMSRKYSERLSDGLSELTDNGIVPVVEQKGKEYILDLSPFEINHEGKDGKKQHFTVLELDEVQHILNITGTKKDKFSLLRYFAAMMSTINASATIKSDMGVHSKSNFVGFVSQNYIGELCNVTSASTIISYNKLLEQEKLIYIYRNPELIRDPETGKYRNFTNHYGRYRDRWEIEEYAINRNGYEELMNVPKSDAELAED